MKRYVAGMAQSRASNREDAFIRAAIICLNGYATIMLWLFSPTSMTARLNDAGGVMADVVQVAMALLVLGGLIDLVVNDWTPWWGARIETLATYRHAGYMALGATYIISAAASLLDGPIGSWVLISTYLIIGTFCFSYVFHRIHARVGRLKMVELEQYRGNASHAL